MRYSIIIPTYNRKDLLEKCINSIIQHTELTPEIEIIAVCNGCHDGSLEIMQAYNKIHSSIKVVYWPEPLGFSRAINMGLAVSTGEYVILLNNDCFILNNTWLEVLEHPFKVHSKTGITGPALQKFTSDLQGFIFFLVMIKREVIKAIGYLDEIFEVGHGEDADYTFRTLKAGFEVYQVPYNTDCDYAKDRGMIIGGFPIYHESFQTRKNISGMDEVIKKNSLILRQRYNLPG